MYTVIGTVRSRAARVLWMLEELGLPYEHVNASPHSDAARSVNPTGKVPVLLVDGTAIIDSTAILQFLADRHDALTYPAGTMERAQQDSLTQFLLDEFDAALWLAARHGFLLPESLRVPAIKPTLLWEFDRSQKALVRRMGEGPFLMGETMTVPDIILGQCGTWAAAARFPITEQRLVDTLARLHSRPAFARAMAR